MSWALGIDASTQSCSALVIDPAEGTVIAEASVNFGQRLPQYGAPNGFIPNGCSGEVHADPRMWLDALDLLFQDLTEQIDLSRVKVISGAGQQHGSVYLGNDWETVLAHLDPGKPLSLQIAPALTRESSPIWMDDSTPEECREIAQVLGGDKEVCRRTGSVMTERFTGPQIRKFFKEQPNAYVETRRIHLVSSFFCSVLTAKDAPLDTGDGAGMNLLAINGWKWDDDLLQATAPQLEEKLPRVVTGDHPAGVLGPYFVKKFGFADQIPVLVFSGDNPSSLVGAGAARSGSPVISLGTSDTIFAALPEVSPDPNGSGHVFGNPLGGGMSLQCFVNGSLAREAVRDRFHLDWEGFTRALQEAPVGNNGNIMVPFFRSEISPRVALEAPLLAGDRAFVSGENAGSWVRGCVEGQCLNFKTQTAWMGLSPESILLTGGASRNDAIAQVVADVFQTPVDRLAVENSVALGAAMRAAAVSGRVGINDLEERFCRVLGGERMDPDPACGEIYAKLEKDFRELLGTVLD